MLRSEPRGSAAPTYGGSCSTSCAVFLLFTMSIVRVTFSLSMVSPNPHFSDPNPPSHRLHRPSTTTRPGASMLHYAVPARQTLGRAFPRKLLARVGRWGGTRRAPLRRKRPVPRRAAYLHALASSQGATHPAAGCRKMDAYYEWRKDWTPIPYWMEGAAEPSSYTPFDSEPDAAPSAHRRRPVALFANYSYLSSPIGMERPQADHRRHAEIENAIRDPSTAASPLGASPPTAPGWPSRSSPTWPATHRSG